MKHFIVDDQHNDQRLDKFLTEKLGQTRSQIKHSILREEVLVNKKKAKVHQFLKAKDVITLDSVKTPEIKPIKKSLTDRLKLTKKGPTPRIIKKTDDYFVLEKPAGMLVHPTAKNETNTLIHWLTKKYPEIKKVADTMALQKRNQPFRPGVVHRLDREVSGLILVARNQTAFDYLKTQFKTRKVHKEYLALVNGQLTQDAGRIDFEISMKTTGGRMGAHPKGSNKGLMALTDYEVLEKFRRFTLVKVKIITGRTNQIRVHFLALGYPLAGDELYKLKHARSRTRMKFERLFLHAHKLEFTDLNGEGQKYESNLPEELEMKLRGLRGN